jgi:TMEM199 family protein
MREGGRCIALGSCIKVYQVSNTPYLIPSSFPSKIEMVQLTITAAAKAAIEEYCRLKRASEGEDEEQLAKLQTLSKAELGSPIDHHELVHISKYLVQQHKDGRSATEDRLAKQWRLDTLLKGATIYQPPPPPKPEPVC